MGDKSKAKGGFEVGTCAVENAPELWKASWSEAGVFRESA